MGLHKVDKEYWDKLLNAYRKYPGGHGAVARELHADVRTVRKAWELGFRYTSYPAAHQPIREIIEAEEVYARAQMAEAQKLAVIKEAELERARKNEVAERARRDAVEARTQEAGMVRLGRTSSIGLLISLNKLNQGISKLAESLDVSMREICKDTATGLPRKMGVVEMQRTAQLLNTLSSSVRQANEAAGKALEMERILLGEPTKIIGVQVESMTLAEASRTVRLAIEASERLKARGVIVEALPPCNALSRGVPQEAQSNGDTRPPTTLNASAMPIDSTPKPPPVGQSTVALDTPDMAGKGNDNVTPHARAAMQGIGIPPSSATRMEAIYQQVSTSITGHVIGDAPVYPSDLLTSPELLPTRADHLKVVGNIPVGQGK
jgi:hypothetical protein